LAGALEQHGVATLVGTKTFGKGSVQELVPVTEDTALKVTVARWIMPNGKNLSSGGIDPNVLVEYTQEDADNDRDPQLERALELIRLGKFPPRADTLATPATTTPQ
jgi:carboxyl-terminal processing protease